MPEQGRADFKSAGKQSSAQPGRPLSSEFSGQPKSYARPIGLGFEESQPNREGLVFAIICVLLLMNLILVGNVNISGSGKEEVGGRVETGLNLITVAFMIVQMWKFPVRRIAAAWMIVLMGIGFSVSLALNLGQSTRLIAGLLFFLLICQTLIRPSFFGMVFRALVRRVYWFVAVLGGIVAFLNWDILRVDFIYKKSLGNGFSAILPFTNENLLCQNLDVVAILLAAMIVTRPTLRAKMPHFVALLVISNLILATVSRGGIVQLLVVWLIAMTSVGVDLTKRLRPVFLVVLGVFAFITLFYAGSSLADAAGSFIDTNYVSAGDRGELLSRAVTVDAFLQLLDDPYRLAFGAGAGNGGFKPKYFIFRYGTFSSHNSYLDIVAQFGLVFAIPLFIVFISSTVKLWTCLPKGASRFLFFLLLASLIHPMTEAFFFFRFGVTSDIVRFSLLGYLLNEGWIVRSLKTNHGVNAARVARA